MVSDVINVQQQTFIAALLTGKTISESSLMAGVTRRTGTTWLSDASHPVRIEYEKQRLHSLDEMAARLHNLHDLALKALEDFLKPGASERFQATKLIYESQFSQAKHSEPAEKLLSQEQSDTLMNSLLGI